MFHTSSFIKENNKLESIPLRKDKEIDGIKKGVQLHSFFIVNQGSN